MSPPDESGAASFDIFVSYASEDRAAIARPLAEALRDHGHRVFFDEFELVAGAHLSATIDAGLARARWGVVILSPAFFAKRWPKQELESLTTRETRTGQDLILPVWHGVDERDVAHFSPALADRVAISSADGIEVIVAKLERAVQRRALTSGSTTRRRKVAMLARRALGWLKKPPGPIATLAILVLAGVAVFVITKAIGSTHSPQAEVDSKGRPTVISSVATPQKHVRMLPAEQVTLRGFVAEVDGHQIGLALGSLLLSNSSDVVVRTRCIGCADKSEHTLHEVSALRGKFLPLRSTLEITVTRAGWIGRYMVIHDAGSPDPRTQTSCLPLGSDQPVPCLAT
jgi:hypothetical protein